MEENIPQTQEVRKGMTGLAILGLFILLAVIGGVFFLGKGKAAISPTMTSTSNQTLKATTAPTVKTSSDSAMSHVTELTVEGGNFYFKPNQITVKKGEKVKITFNNADGMHDFVIDELNVHTPTIPGGKSASVEFTADKTGTFAFYCSVGNHRQMGMKGTVIVQ